MAVIISHSLIYMWENSCPPWGKFGRQAREGCWSEAGEVKWCRGVDGVAEGRVGRLDSQVSQHEGVGLDAVALLVVVGGVQELPGEVGPLASHPLAVQTAHVDQLLLQRQDSARVGPLRAGNRC